MITEKKSTVTTEGNVSKAQQLVEAARRRNQVEQEMAENAESGVEENGVPKDEEAREAMIEAAEAKASVKPQAVAGSLAGIDVEAEGDVKGDGGDAKNYDDDDPDKALGVPTFVHGLNETTATGDSVTNEAANPTRISKRTEAEMARGREALNRVQESREQARNGRVTVTDADNDPDGSKGRAAAEKAAEKAAKTRKK